MKKIFTLLFVAATTCLFAQSTLQKNIYLPAFPNAMLTDVQPTSDGGYLLTTTDYDVNFFGIAFITKMDVAAQVQWTKQISKPNESCVVYTAADKIGGGYYCLGTVGIPDSMSGSNKFFLSALDINGNIVWTKTYANASGYAYPYASPKVKQLPNGDFVLSMNVTESMGILRIDGNGNLLWGKEFYDDPSKNPSFDALPTPDGGFISCGKRGSDKMYVKVDGNGAVQWSKILTDVNYTYNHPKSMTNTSDGNIISAGMETDNLGSTLGFIMKMDNNGSPLWYKTYSNSAMFYFKEVLELYNGNLALVGVDGYTSLPVVVITDANGNTISSNVIGSAFPYDDNFIFRKNSTDDLILAYQPNGVGICLFKSNWTSMLWCDKNNYTLTVTTVTYAPNSSAALTQVNSGTQGTNTLTVTSAAANTTNYCASTGIADANNSSEVNIYPNPTNDVVNVSVNTTGKMKLCNVLGEEVGNWTLNIGENKIDVSSLAKGVYFYSIADSEGNSSAGKIVIQR